MKKKLRKYLSWVMLAAMLVCLGLAGWQIWGYYHTRTTTDLAKNLAGLDESLVYTAPEPAQLPTPAPTTQAVTTPAPIPTPTVTPQPDLTPAATPAATTPPPTTPAPTQDPYGVAAAQTKPLAEDALFLFGVKLEPLQEVNEDVLGWICIPGTQVSYPLMRGEDNSYYLKHAWDGTYSAAGSIFLECQNQASLLDFNTIVYGHHMGNGSCFAQITHYKKEEFYREHPCVYIVTQNDLRRYEIFAAYEAPIDSETYRIRISDPAKKQTALDHYIQSSLWKSEITPDLNSYILTLSTCVGNGRYENRFVVQAVLTGIWLR